MPSKNAIGNLKNRYLAVLKKCHLLNTFGSLGVACMLSLGVTANAQNLSDLPSSTSINSTVNIGTGKVDNGSTSAGGGPIWAGAVQGDGQTDIIITNGSFLGITGNGGQTELFQNAGTGEIFVHNGELELGNNERTSSLQGGNITLGYVGNDPSENTSGHLSIVGSTILDLVETSPASEGNSVTVDANGGVDTFLKLDHLDLGPTNLGNNVFITANKNGNGNGNASLFTNYGNVGGDIILTAGALTDAYFGLSLGDNIFTYYDQNLGVFNVAGEIKLDGKLGGKAILEVLANNVDAKTNLREITLNVQELITADNANINVKGGAGSSNIGLGDNVFGSGTATLNMQGGLNATDSVITIEGANSAGGGAGEDRGQATVNIGETLTAKNTNFKVIGANASDTENSDGGSAILNITGQSINVDTDTVFELRGGNALGLSSGGNAILTVGGVSGSDIGNTEYGSGHLGSFNIIAGSDDDIALGGTGGVASLNIAGGLFTADTISINANGQASSNLTVGYNTAHNSSLTVESLQSNSTYGANILVQSIDNATSLLSVTNTYSDSVNTKATVDGNNATFDLSNTVFGTSDINGKYYLQNGGTLAFNELNIDSSKLANLDSGQDGTFYFSSVGNSHGNLVAKTLTFTDTSDTINLTTDGMVLKTSSLKTGENAIKNIIIGQDNPTDLTQLHFTGGGSINANLTTKDYGVVVIDSLAVANTVVSKTGVTDEQKTTKLAIGTTLNIVAEQSLNIKGDAILDASQASLSVENKGFISRDDLGNGTGSLIANAKDFGFENMADATQYSSTAYDNRKVQDIFTGSSLTLEGFTAGESITEQEYNKYLSNYSYALVGSYTKLYMPNAYVSISNTGILDQIPAGSAYYESSNVVIGSGIFDVAGVGSVGSIDGMATGVDIIIKNESVLFIHGINGGIINNAVNENTGQVSDLVVENGAVIIGNKNSTVSLGESVSPKSDDTSDIFLGVEDTGTIPSTNDSTGGALAVVGDFDVNNIITKANQEGNFITITENSTLDAISIIMSDTVMSVGGTMLNSQDTYETPGHLVAELVDIDAASSLLAGSNGAPATVAIDAVGGAGLIFGDPAWNGNIFDGSHIAVGEFSGGATSNQLISGQNTFFALGTSDTNKFVNDINMLEQANMGVDWNGTTTGMAFYAPQTLTTSGMSAGSILVDNSVVEGSGVNDNKPVRISSGVETPVVRPTNETAHFAKNTITLVDAIPMSNNATVLTSASKNGAFILDPSADLIVLGGIDGQNIKMIEGFTTLSNTSGAVLDSTSKGWGLNNALSTDGKLILDSRLMAKNSSIQLVGNDIVVNMQAGKAVEVYENMQKGVGAIFDSVADVGLNINSENAGIRYISSLDSQAQTAGVATSTISQTAESSMQLATLGATNKISMDASKLASEAVWNRNSILNNKALADETSGNRTVSTNEIADNRFNLWFDLAYQYGNIDNLKAGNFNAGYDISLGGVVLGADYKITPELIAGTSLSFGAGEVESSGDLTSTTNEIDYVGLSAYLAYQKNNWSLTADLGYTMVNNDITQRAFFADYGKLTADPDSDVLTVGLRGEYLFKTSYLNIMPHASVRYMNVSTESYDTTSNLGRIYHTQEDTQGIWYLPVGITFNKNFQSESGWEFSPSLDLGFIVAAGDLEASSSVSIPGVNRISKLNMENVDNFTFAGGLGFKVKKDNLSFLLNYNIEANENQNSHLILANFKYEF